MGWNLRMGRGFEQNSPYFIPMGDNPKAFGKFGSGGAIGFCDREKIYHLVMLLIFNAKAPVLAFEAAY